MNWPASLAWRGNKARRDLFVKALRDKEPRVRAAAASALGRLGDEKSVGLLADATDDTDEYVRAAALTALHGIGTDEAQAVVRDAALSSDGATYELALSLFVEAEDRAQANATNSTTVMPPEKKPEAGSFFLTPKQYRRIQCNTVELKY